jgi:small redox-active disulfide protein 2
LNADDWRAWLWESWRFVKQIFLLLMVGVFTVGVIRQLVQPEWIQTLAGRNDLLANAVAVVFGVFMYFPTLVEVPVARMFLDLGMHPGPLLAYLMADPELSLQSILMVAAVIGRAKTFAYVGLGGGVQHHCRTAVRRLGGRCRSVVACAGAGRLRGRACRRLGLAAQAPAERRPRRVIEQEGETTMLTVKILGSGCANCRKLEAVAREAAAGVGIAAEFVKVTDMNAIMADDVLSTPGLVINEKLVSSGRIPSQAEIRQWMSA